MRRCAGEGLSSDQLQLLRSFSFLECRLYISFNFLQISHNYIQTYPGRPRLSTTYCFCSLPHFQYMCKVCSTNQHVDPPTPHPSVGQKKVIVRDAFPIKDKSQQNFHWGNKSSCAMQLPHRRNDFQIGHRGKVLESTTTQQAVNQSEKEKRFQKQPQKHRSRSRGRRRKQDDLHRRRRRKRRGVLVDGVAVLKKAADLLTEPPICCLDVTNHLPCFNLGFVVILNEPSILLMDHLVTSEGTLHWFPSVFSCRHRVPAIIRPHVSSTSLPPATVRHAWTDRCSAVSHEMSYGFFLLHTCDIHGNNTSPTETTEINLIISCCYVVFL